MKSAYLLLLAGFVTGLAGCSSTPAEQKAPASVAEQAVCCTDISQFSFVPLSPRTDLEVTIDNSTPAFNFSTGKSRFLAYALPVNGGQFTVTVMSMVRDNTLFASSVMLLNKDFKPVRVIPFSEFKYVPSTFLDGDIMTARFVVQRNYRDDPNNELYMVLLTTNNDLADTTQLIHPAKVYAEAQSLAVPDIDDPKAVHVQQGVMRVTFGDNGSQGALSRTTGALSDWLFGKEDVATGQAMATPANASAAPTANNAMAPRSVPMATTPVATPYAPSVPVSGATMLPETEQFYLQQIKAAVAERDIDKALRLVNEAERAGSQQARSTFVEAVKTLK